MTVKTLRRQLAAAIAMTLVSTVALGSSTYAWFTMNKEVEVTGMQLQAHAEEGLLINEVKAAGDNYWDELAQAAATPVTYQLRPASTSDLSTWWHANSKKFSDEAGVDAITDTVDVDSSGNKYTNISLTGGSATDETIIGAENAGSGAKATGGTQAETHVYYSDASYGNATGYENGEGFYVNYKYYLKSSSSTAINVSNLQVEVTASLVDTSASATNLDKALRVGVKIDDNVRIFAPVSGGQTSYDVTGNAAGATANKIPVTAYATATSMNPTSGTDTTISIPAVTSDGKLVDVFVWFEGEDEACMSQNLTATLNAYKIDIKITDNDLN